MTGTLTSLSTTKRPGKTSSSAMKKENKLGMKVVEVNGSNLESVAVRILFGGEEAKFTYEATQIDPQPVAGVRDKIKRDSKGRAVTSEELVKKYYTMNDKQRAYYQKWRESLIKAKPELRYSESRFPMAHKAMDAIKRGERPPPIR